MKAMSRASERSVRSLAACFALIIASGCHKDEPAEGDKPQRPMDGLERYTARTVSIETAIGAMQDRDLKKLKMLSVWVRKRDKAVLLGDDDLSSLDLAVACLEANPSKDERTAALDRIKSGKLKAAARDLCLAEED